MAYRPPDDDPFKMKGKMPPKETKEGYQDTSVDDAERDFGMDSEMGSEQSVSQTTREKKNSIYFI